MSKQNSQTPAWGAPISASWGSPLTTNARAGANSPSQTPVPPSRENFPAQLNRSNSHSYRAPNPGNNGSPIGGNFNYNSPRHFQPRPRYQSSPLHNGGTPTPRFNRHNSSQDFTPSPRHHHHQQGNSRFNFHRDRRSFQRDRSMNNPGGSDNINDYIHPSMLEDPWKDLQPKPLLRQY